MISRVHGSSTSFEYKTRLQHVYTLGSYVTVPQQAPLESNFSTNSPSQQKKSLSLLSLYSVYNRMSVRILVMSQSAY